jgi:outer membrane scaffolding protein for murein synthesis (MipA/OmpV family)
LLAGDAYGNIKFKRSFGQKDQTSHNIGAYENGKKVVQVFRPSAKSKKERDQWTQNKTKNNWSIMLDGLGAVKPKYKGSSQHEISGYPFIDIKYKRILFLNFREGLGINILHAPNFRVGAAFNFYGSRNEDDSTYLQGFQDVEAGLETGVFGFISSGNFSTRLQFRKDISDNHEGYLFYGRFIYKAVESRKLMVNLNIKTTYASDSYMKTYFGVTTSQASASGLKAFNANGGIKDVGAGTNLIYPFDKYWSLIAIANYTRLLKDAANSPLVEI